MIGLVMIAIEMGHVASTQYFLFLNFGWGKVFLNLFLGVSVLSFKEKALLDWVAAIYFWIMCFFDMFVYIKFKAQEMDRT